MQAESPAYRLMVEDWWNDVAETRIEPGGSAFITHTRWNTDDLINHVINGEGAQDWAPHIKLSAVSNAGKALWPERWPLPLLEKKRRNAGEYTWASLYQGDPRPRGGKIFRDVAFYDELPPGFRVAVGVDFAYTEKKYADYSAAVVLATDGLRYYVLDVVRVQLEPPSFRRRLVPIARRYTNVPFVAYTSTTEKGVVTLMRDPPPPKWGEEDEPIVLNFEARLAVADKFVRAQPVAAAWNDGRVLIPRGGAPWADLFVRELSDFTGTGKEHDDQVDFQSRDPVRRIHRQHACLECLVVQGIFGGQRKIVGVGPHRDRRGHLRHVRDRYAWQC